MSTPGAPSTSTAAATSCQKITIPDFAELYQANFLDVLLPPSADEEYHIINPAAPPTVKNELLEALKATSHQTFTANNAPAFSSTLSATLDAFNGLTSGTYGSTVTSLLNNAWKEDSAITLRLIWSLRSIHNGKGEREVFYRSFGWLYDNHPRTAISNLHLLVDPVCGAPGDKKIEGLAHGYWKDLLNILALATVDELSGVAGRPEFLHHPRQKIGQEKRMRLRSKKQKSTPSSNAAISLTHIEEAQEKAAKIKKTAKGSRDDRQTERHMALLKKLDIPKFRALYIAVARLFAERLGKDIKLLDEIKALVPDDKNRILLVKQLSLAGKWAPTPGCSHDLVTNIATAISLLIHSSQTFTSYPTSLNQPSIEKQERALILRSFYQRWVLTELRRELACPEPLMATNRWDEIRYNRVPSLSMKLNTPHFFKHNPEGFEKYLISVEKGKKTISGATLLPHTLVSQIVSLHAKAAKVEGDNKPLSDLQKFKKELASTELRVVEAQWKTLIESVRSSGTLDNCIAVCDVSGSMGSLSYCLRQHDKKDVLPIVPAIALSLVLATVAQPPFNGGFITFSNRPAFVTLDLTKSLYDQVMDLSRADWGMNTDINAVFMKLLLPLAIKNKIPQDQMIKRLFVFTDMQFDNCHGSSAVASNWQTNYDVIEEAYRAAGYEVPQIVYWDLATGSGRTVEVEGDRKGVAMMNGFSPALLKVFMGETEVDEWEKVTEDGESKTVVDDQFTPVNVMRKALTHSSFDKLQVLD